MGLISAEAVREQAERIAAWTQRQAQTEAQRFTGRQPFVSSYVFATLEEEGREATGFTLQLALTIDKLYQRVLGGPTKRITAEVMEEAATDAEHGFEQLVGVEPELALRRMLFQRDLAEPELLAELMRLMFEESEQDPELEPAVGATFLALKTVALAYERANGLGAEESKGSLGNVLEAQLGHPLPKIGRNDPCPCGSGKRFKKCCGQLQAPPDPEQEELSPREALGDSRTEQCFLEYMDMVSVLAPFYELLCRQRDGQWLRGKDDEFEERFEPGQPGGVPDSFHVGYLLLDLQLPSSRKSVAQLFLEQERHALPDRGQALLADLIGSYPAFYQLIELRPEDGTKRLRELATGTEWIIGDVDDPAATCGDAGEVWFCRFVGPRTDAVTFMSPLIFPPIAREELEQMVCDFLRPHLAGGLPPEEAISVAMKRQAITLAEFLLASQEEDDENGDEDTPSLLDLEEEELEDDSLLDCCDDPECDEHDPLDVQRIVGQFSADYYRRWVDEPVPALGGATPREAARSEKGRALLAALLDQFEEQNRDRTAALPPVDVAWLRRELKMKR